MSPDQILAFRLARQGLARREARSLAEAAACPASDYTRTSAYVALAARTEGISHEAYDDAIDSGELLVAHVIRGAIHALAPDDHGRYGRALIATDERELERQAGVSPAALAQVAEAIEDALKGGAKLDRVELHEAMRQRLPKPLLPWCKNCASHHVAPMVWRYGTVQAGARLDSQRRYVAARPSKASAADAARGFLRFYGPAKPGDFAAWAGIAPAHAKRVWAELELTKTDDGWLAPEDEAALAAPPQAEGIRLLPPGDPYLQKPNRTLLAPDKDLHKRMFRPLGSPGAILKDGRLVGLWKLTKGELQVEKLGRFAQADVEREAERIR